MYGNKAGLAARRNTGKCNIVVGKIHLVSLNNNKIFPNPTTTQACSFSFPRLSLS